MSYCVLLRSCLTENDSAKYFYGNMQFVNLKNMFKWKFSHYFATSLLLFLEHVESVINGFPFSTSSFFYYIYSLSSHTTNMYCIHYWMRLFKKENKSFFTFVYAASLIRKMGERNTYVSKAWRVVKGWRST